MDFMRLTAGLSALYETLNRNHISILNDEIYKYTNPNALLLVKGLISTCVVSLLTHIKHSRTISRRLSVSLKLLDTNTVVTFG